MNDPEVQARKVGRPSTRAAARGRSNSLDGSPTLQRRLSATQLFNLPAVGPIVDEFLGELPLDRNPQAANNPIPPVNAAPIPEPDPEVPAAEQPAHNIPPPVAPIPPAPENPEPNPDQQANMKLRREARRIIAEGQEFIEVNEGIEVNPILLAAIERESLRLVSLITSCLDRVPDDPDWHETIRELTRWRKIVKMFVASMMGKYKTSPPTASAPQPSPAPRERRDVPNQTLELTRRDLTFFMSKLHDSLMPDIGMGSDVSSTVLRDLHNFTLPQISKSIDDCRRVLKIYTSNSVYDDLLARDAQERCEEASIWDSNLQARYHSQQLHLDKNTKHREITFSPFKPGGDVSIYQFLISFETWADGY